MFSLSARLEVSLFPFLFFPLAITFLWSFIFLLFLQFKRWVFFLGFKRRLLSKWQKWARCLSLLFFVVTVKNSNGSLTFFFILRSEVK